MSQEADVGADLSGGGTEGGQGTNDGRVRLPGVGLTGHDVLAIEAREFGYQIVKLPNSFTCNLGRKQLKKTCLKIGKITFKDLL